MAAVTLAMGTDAAYVEPANATLQWHGPSPKLGDMVSVWNFLIIQYVNGTVKYLLSFAGN